MSIINVPVLGSPNNLRRQLRTGVLTDNVEMPRSSIQGSLPRSIQRTLRPSSNRSSVRHDPSEVIDDELGPALPNSTGRKRAPTPHPHSPVVRDFAFPNTAHPNDGEAIARAEDTSVGHLSGSRNHSMADNNSVRTRSSIPFNRRLGLRKAARKLIPPPRPISFNFDDINNNANNINTTNHRNNNTHIPNREPAPIPLLSRSALRQKVARLRLRHAQQSNPSSNPNPQPNTSIIKHDSPSRNSRLNLNHDRFADPPTLGRGFFGFPDKSRYFKAMRKHQGHDIPVIGPSKDESTKSLDPLKRVRFKSISSIIRRNTWNKNKNVPKERSHKPLTGHAPLPRDVSNSRIPPDARRKRVIHDIPNIDIRPPTPPLLDSDITAPAPIISTSRQKGRMSIPKVHMPSMRVSKRLGFNKWRNIDARVDGIEGNSTPAGHDAEPSQVVMQHLRHSIKQGKREREKLASASREDRDQYQDRNLNPTRHDRTSSLLHKRPRSSVRHHAMPSIPTSSIRQRATSSQSNRPPSIRQRVASLTSNRTPSIRQPTPSVRSNRPPSASITAHAPSATSHLPTSIHRISASSNQDPAARSSRSVVLTPTATMGRVPRRFVSWPKIPNRMRMHMPVIRVWRIKEKGEILEHANVGTAREREPDIGAVPLVQASSLDELNPSSVVGRGTRTMRKGVQVTRTIRKGVQVTRPLLHPILLTPTLLRPARLHWDVRDPQLTQPGIAEQVVKAAFTGLTTTVNNDLFIPIPLPLTSSTTTFFSAFTSKSPNKYWKIAMPVSTYSSEGTVTSPTVLNILNAISVALRERATPDELRELYNERNARYRRVVEQMFRRRCEKEDREREMEKDGTGGRSRSKQGGKGRQERIGMRRVDLLGTKTRWLGLEHGKDAEGWIVRLGHRNLR